MLRIAHFNFQAVRPLVVQRTQGRRGFVSPVLLTRTWENENIATLRREAKNRGLSAKGSKANLILRISEHDTQNTPHDIPAPTPANTRSGSSSAPHKSAAPGHFPHTVAPGPGVPHAAATAAPVPQHELLNIVIPDLSQPDLELPVEVPYVPDFWDSTAFEKQTVSVASEDLPKMVVVGGLSTYYGDGPTHNLETVSEDESIVANAASGSSEEPKKSPTETGFFEDITEDLGIPPPKELKQSFWKLFS